MKKEANLLQKRIIEHITENMIPVKWTEVTCHGEITSIEKGNIVNVKFSFIDENQMEIQSHKIPELYNVSRIDHKRFRAELCKKMYELYEFLVDTPIGHYREIEIKIDDKGEIKGQYYYNDDETESFYEFSKKVIMAYEEDEKKAGEYLQKIDEKFHETGLINETAVH